MAWLPIAYGDFYDIPRCVLVKHDSAHFLLDAPFDEDLDDYPSISTSTDWNQQPSSPTPRSKTSSAASSWTNSSRQRST